MNQAPVKSDPAETLPKPFSFDGWGFEMPELGTAERRAKMEDDGATYFESRGNSDLAEKARTMATWWRELPTVPDEAIKPYYETAEGEARDVIDALLVRAETDGNAWLPLQSLAWQILWGFHARAAHNKGNAASVLVNLLHGEVDKFNLLADSKPEIFKPLLRQAIGLPGIISPNAEKTKDNARLVEKLEVGIDHKFAIRPTGKKGKKWEFQGKANALAARLQGHIETARISHTFDKLVVESKGQSLPSWRDDAMHLEPFSSKTWRTWAEMAWRVLAEITPDGKPGRHPAFYEEATKICNVRKKRTNPYFGNTEDAPSIAESDIKESLVGAFRLISGGLKPSKKKSPKARKSA